MGIMFSRTSAVRGEGTSEMADESEIVSGASTCSDSASEENSPDRLNKNESRSREMIAFKEQLALKREQRRAILARHKAEKENLKKSLELEQRARRDLSEENKILREKLIEHNIDIDLSYREREDISIHDTIRNMREEFEVLRENNKRLRKELAESNLSLQQTNADLTSLQCQNIELTKQIAALKEVIAVSKTMIKLREQQLNELKEKLNQIEQSLADKESNLLSADLRQEYERQLQNIRTLRTLYEERARLAEVTRLNLLRELEEQKALNVAEVNKSNSLENTVAELELKLSDLTTLLEQKDDVITTCQNEATELKTEMTAINTLFSQVLLGFKNDLNLDTLTDRLKEHQGILTHMAKCENGSGTSSALPRVLLQLVSQIEDSSAKIHIDYKDPIVPITFDRPSTMKENCEENTSSINITPEEIVKNLPKVWKVLMELLCHQNDVDTTEKSSTCYKTVETSSGSVLVPSVSQTYIRLKDLIVEKLALIKEMNRMKQLNSHLETRLQEQERRLCLVTSELSKTWHVVGRLRRHHHQLHTHEKILKYELQQKRKLLNELKEELAYCREKLEKAREKNMQSERDWKKLRADFSSRRGKGNSSLNNSGESGYSDERHSDTSESNDESEYVNEPPIKCKIKLRSFDVVDYSTEMYLAAEREDPISDLTDVVDLPLDGQEADDNTGIRSSTPQNEAAYVSIPESSVNVSKYEKTDENEESEDENENEEVPEQSDVDETDSENKCNTCAFSSNVINELNSNCNNVQEIAESTSKEKETYGQNIKSTTSRANDVENSNIEKQKGDITIKINPAAILENIRRQNEMLAKKDAKLQSLERNSAMLLQKAQGTINLGEQISSTLDHILNRPSTSLENSRSIVDNRIPNDLNAPAPLDVGNTSELQNTTLTAHNDRFNNSNNDKTMATSKTEGNLIDENNGTSKSYNSPETSTSKQDVDHEARFAAREERLKRLEEQTKSLVSKVNNTTTKRIKLKYKLEELHNIYGSENSRAGTPSGETEEDDTNDDGMEDTEEQNDENNI